MNERLRGEGEERKNKAEIGAEHLDQAAAFRQMAEDATDEKERENIKEQVRQSEREAKREVVANKIAALFESVKDDFKSPNLVRSFEKKIKILTDSSIEPVQRLNADYDPQRDKGDAEFDLKYGRISQSDYEHDISVIDSLQESYKRLDDEKEKLSWI